MTKTGKKGATLVELCVVLALIAVVSGMVVSFALTISARTGLSAARLNAMGELELVESVTEGWMTRAINEGSEFNRNDISFDSGEKTLTAGDVSVRLEQVSNIEFSFLDNGGDILCICKVTDFAGVTHTICVNPHVGDTYG